MTHSSVLARDVRPGDLLFLATGCVKVLEAYLSHGGVELLVRPHPTRKGTGASRLLWAYPGQELECEAISRILPQDSLKPRPPRPLSGVAKRGAVE